MANRARDWLRQADADIRHARSALELGDYVWSCFAAQQGAEKAVKALMLELHGDPWGHSVLALLQGLPEPQQTAVGPELLDAARALDKHYIPARYPNGFAQGAPIDYYTRRDAEDAVAHGESILSFCRSAIRGSGPDPDAGTGDGGATGSTRS
jgi:HEPN domain-containing protein